MELFSGEVSVPKIKVTATESAPLPKRTLSRTRSGQPAGQKMQLSRTFSLTSGYGQSPVKDTRNSLHVGSQNPTHYKEPVNRDQLENQITEQRVTSLNCGPVPNIRFGEINSDITSYPQHWSKRHEDLKYTVSEPIPCQEPPLRGHLALAKKLSDEGRKDDGNRKDGTQNLHKKLNRQLSLKGSEDPRLKQKMISYYFGDNPTKSFQDKNKNYAQNTQQRLIQRPSVKTQPLTKQNSAKYLSPFSQNQMATHNAVLRMSSDPSKAGSDKPKFGNASPRMERQNSTSDPQLYIPKREDLGDSDVFVVNEQSVPVPCRNEPSETGAPIGLPYVTQDRMPAMPVSQNMLQYPPPINVSMSEQNLHFGPTSQHHFNVFNPEMPSIENFHLTPENQRSQTYGLPPKVHAHSNPNLYHQNEQFYQLQSVQHGHPIMKNHANFGSESPSLSLPLNDSDRHLGLVDTKDAILWGNSQNIKEAWPDPVTQQQDDVSSGQKNMMTKEDLYFHLCGLFPNEKVAKVMKDHPEERDPAILCKFILSLD